MRKITKRFFAKYSKSSATVVTLMLHAVIVVAGLSLVVVKQVIRVDPDFVAVPVVERKSMPPRKLVVPVNVKETKPKKPKFERIKVKPDVARNTPEFQLPDFGNLKGTLGAASGDGLAAGSSLGFMMPEINIIGTKAKGEKFFLILDSGNHMLEDRMGGIPAYTIIKQELVRVIDKLPPTALFNVCVFGNEGTMTLFPKLVSANEENARKVEAWLAPLNASETAVESGRYGMKTLGKGGIRHRQDHRLGKFGEPSKSSGVSYHQERWFLPAMVAMEQQADTVFLLTNAWGHQRVASSERVDREAWSKTSAGKRWNEHIEKARLKLAEENEKRSAAGQPPRVISEGNWGLMKAYYPEITRPPSPEFYYFTPRDFTETFDLVRSEYRPEGLPEKSGLKKRRKNEFTFNVVQFIPAGSNAERSVEKFKKLVGLCRGDYQSIAGLDAIQSYLNESRGRELSYEL